MKRQPRIPVLVLALALLVLAGIFGVRWLFPKHIAAPAASSSAAASANVETPPTPSSGNKYPRNEPKAPRRLASGTAENDAALTSGAFEGRVVSWSTGKGVAGATITFVHAGVTASVTAGEGGNFRFVPSESGLYEIAIVAAEGYLPFAPAIDQSPLALTARPGERIRDILLYLTPAIQYAGIVLGPSKEPVAGAEVRLFSEDGGDVKIAPLPDRFTTDAKGEFRFSAPDYALLLATHPDYAPGRARIDLSAQTSRRVALRLKPSTENAPRAVIAGRV
ncbi:MAG: carboxypeptidase-like regulatory domain-containing protein, partial [Polyangiaceae bacterium]|nr:carboxypeptidase-like regulatory domain-containing protein [Polyangiaceae bacterium]